MRPTLPLLAVFLCAGLAGCDTPPPSTGSDTGVPPGTDGGLPDTNVTPGVDSAVDANVDAFLAGDTGMVAVVDLDRDDDGIPDAEDALPDDPHEVYDDDRDGMGNLADLDEDGDGVPDTTDLLPFDPAGNDYPEERETEPNDVPSQASAATGLPVRMRGALDTLAPVGGDVDALSFPLTGGGGVSFVVRGAAGARIDLQESTLVTRFPVAERVRSDGARVLTVLIDEGPAVVVIDDTASATGRASWSVEAFRDDDLDGVDDDRERARGARSPDPDSDDDLVGDFDEWEPGDPDSDGFPAVLDPDADGDGIPDDVDGIEDDDRDGVPSFLDLDADGHAPDDATSAAFWPEDLDADGRPDFRDLDDDGDGLRDDEDPAPTVPLATPTDPTQWIVITSLETELGADRAPGALVPGELLRIEGNGLGAASTRVVFDVGASYPVSVTPETATGTLLIVRVPAEVETGVLRVIDATRVSDLVRTDHVDVSGGEPLLFAPTAFTSTTGEVLRGVHLDRVVSVEADGLPQAVAASDLATAAWRASEIRVETLAGFSNTITLRTTADVSIYVGLPAATPARWAALRVSSLVADGTVTGVGVYRVPVLVDTANLPLVFATTTDGRGVGHDCVTMEGYGDHVDPSSTATALAIQYGNLLSAVSVNSQQSVPGVVSPLPEVAALASLLSTRLNTTTCPLESPDATLVAAIVAAMNAAHVEVQAQLAAHMLEPADLPSHPAVVLPIRAAIVTPPEAYDVSVYQRAGTGHLTVENDTSLSLSARMTSASGAVLVPHIASYFDPLVVGPQSGLLTGYRANTQDYEAPNYRSVTVQIVTPGHAAPQPTESDARDAQWTLAMRSAVEGLFIPMIDEMLPGGHLDAGAFTQLLVQQNYMAVQDLRAGWASGGASGFLGGVAAILVRDFDNFGPITQYLATTLGRQAVGAVLRRLSERIVTWLIPVLGQAEAFFDAVAAGSTLSNLAKVMIDFGSAPGVMEFDVNFGLSLDALEPLYVERADHPQRFSLTGTGFISRDMSGRPVQPTVTVRDLGRGGTPLTLPATAVRQGTMLWFEVPGSFLRASVGGLSVTVTSGAQTEEHPARVEVGQTLRLRAATPDTVGPSERIALDGAGFGATSRDTIVYFQSTDLGILRRGRITSHSPTHIEAITHFQLEPGTGWEVYVEVDGLESNRLPLNVPPLDVDSWARGTTWNVTNFWNACGQMRRHRFVAVFAPRTTASSIFAPAETWGGYESGNFYAYDATRGYRIQSNGYLERSVWLGGRMQFGPISGGRTGLVIGVRDSLIFLNDWFPFSYLSSTHDADWPPPAISPDHRTVRWFHTNSACRMPERAEMTR